MQTNVAATRLRSLITFPIALLIVVLGGMLTGITTAVVGSLFYIALIFPLVMGLAGGNIVVAALQLTRTRKTSLVVLPSVLAASIIYGTCHYGRYVALRIEMALEFSSGRSEATFVEARSARKNTWVERARPMSSFFST